MTPEIFQNRPGGHCGPRWAPDRTQRASKGRSRLPRGPQKGGPGPPGDPKMEVREPSGAQFSSLLEASLDVFQYYSRHPFDYAELCSHLYPTTKKNKKRRRRDKPTNKRMNEQANELTNKRTNERTNERLDERSNKRAHEQTNEQTARRTNRRTNQRNEGTTTRTIERTNETTNEQTKEQTWTT